MENLDEIIFMNNNLGGCFLPELGSLKNLTVFDASFNSFVNALPQEFSKLIRVNVLDISRNKFTGVLLENICKLPSLTNFTFYQNYFNGTANACVPTLRKNIVLDDTGNCLGDRPNQKLGNECEAVLSHPIDCSKDKCPSGSSPKPPIKDPLKPQPKSPIHSPPQQVISLTPRIHSPPSPVLSLPAPVQSLPLPIHSPPQPILSHHHPSTLHLH